jgi:hypothetical protein
MITLLKKIFFVFYVKKDNPKTKVKTKRKYTKRIKTLNNNILTTNKQIVLEKINDVKNDVFDTATIIKFLSICKKLQNKKHIIYRYIPVFHKNNQHVQVKCNPDFDTTKVRYSFDKTEYNFDKTYYFTSIEKNFCDKNRRDLDNLYKLCELAAKYCNINTKNSKHIFFALITNKNYNFYTKRKLFFTNKKTTIRIENDKLFLQNGNFKLKIDINNLLSYYINN